MQASRPFGTTAVQDRWIAGRCVGLLNDGWVVANMLIHMTFISAQAARTVRMRMHYGIGDQCMMRTQFSSMGKAEHVVTSEVV